MQKTRKQPKVKQYVLSAVGILCICASIYYLINGIYSYVHQFSQKDWITTTAIVINVEEQVEKTSMKVSRPTLRRSWTYYDISYQYEVNGDVYTNTIYSSNKAKQQGDYFDIKYDPEEPQNSTQYLKPTASYIASGVIGFVVFGAIGYRIVRRSFPNKKRRSTHRRKAKAEV